jgi:hypothetical protein
MSPGRSLKAGPDIFRGYSDSRFARNRPKVPYATCVISQRASCVRSIFDKVTLFSNHVDHQPSIGPVERAPCTDSGLTVKERILMLDDMVLDERYVIPTFRRFFHAFLLSVTKFIAPIFVRWTRAGSPPRHELTIKMGRNMGSPRSTDTY